MFFFLFVLLFIGGCDANRTIKSAEHPIIDIYPYVHQYEMIDEIDLSTYVDSVAYIALETSEHALITNMSKVLVSSDKLFILDGNTVYIYSKSGKYLNKIYSVGRGFGEYIALNDITIDKERNLLILHCYRTDKKLYFTYDGGFVKEILSQNEQIKYIRKFESLNNGNFLCFNYPLDCSSFDKESSGLWEQDANGNFIRSYMSYNALFPVMHNENVSVFQCNGCSDSIYLRDPIRSNVYMVASGKLDTVVEFRHINTNLEAYKGEVSPRLGEDFYPVVMGLYVGNRIILSRWIDQTVVNSFHILYDKECENVVYSKKLACSDVLLESSVEVTSNLDNAMVYRTLNYSQVEQYINKNRTENKLVRFLSGVEEDSNPILQILYLK